MHLEGISMKFSWRIALRSVLIPMEERRINRSFSVQRTQQCGMWAGFSFLWCSVLFFFGYENLNSVLLRYLSCVVYIHDCCVLWWKSSVGVHMYVYACLCMCMHVHVCVPMFMYVHVCVRMFMSVYSCSCLCTHVRVCVLMFVSVYSCSCLCAHVHVCVLMFMYVYACSCPCKRVFTGVCFHADLRALWIWKMRVGQREGFMLPEKETVSELLYFFIDPSSLL